MVTNVTSLLKTVKTVEDEQQRGTRALEATIDGIDSEIRNYETGNMYIMQEVTPEHLIRITKPVTLATAKAVAAGTSGKQDDVIVVANMGRKAIHDLLMVCRAAANLADSEDLKSRILESGKDCAANYQELLKMIFHILQRPMSATELKHQLTMMSRTIAQSVTDIVSLAEMLKGVDWVDPDDPTFIAENELLGAASSIDLAAKKLANLQPRQTSVKVSGEWVQTFFFSLKERGHLLLGRHLEICLIFLVVDYLNSTKNQTYDPDVGPHTLQRRLMLDILPLVVNQQSVAAKFLEFC